MKKILATVAFSAIFALGLHAQNAIDSFKNSMRGKRAMIEFDVEAEVSGAPVKSKGFAMFEGSCFLLSSHNLQVYCDGESVWVMDMKSEEVTIEEGALDIDSLVASGKISTKGDRITGFEYEDSNGSPIKLSITDYDFTSKGAASDFTPDLKKLSKHWIITDLR